MSENTVRKYICRQEERGLIAAESTEVITKSSGRCNGNLLFTLLPIQKVIDQFYERQLSALELNSGRSSERRSLAWSSFPPRKIRAHDRATVRFVRPDRAGWSPSPTRAFPANLGRCGPR